MNVIDTSTDFGLRVRGELETEQIVWLTTVRSDGTPRPSPVWFLWTGGDVLVLGRRPSPSCATSPGTHGWRSISTPTMAGIG